MRRNTSRTTPTVEMLRRQARRLEAALDAADPGKAHTLFDRMTKLAATLAAAEKDAAEKLTNDELVARRAAFDAKVERMIAERVEERVMYLARPQAWDITARAMRQAIIAGDRDWRKFVETEKAAYARECAAGRP